MCVCVCVCVCVCGWVGGWVGGVHAPIPNNNPIPVEPFGRLDCCHSTAQEEEQRSNGCASVGV